MPQYTQIESRNNDDGRIYAGVESKVLQSSKYLLKSTNFQMWKEDIEHNFLLTFDKGNRTSIELLRVSILKLQSKILEQKTREDIILTRIRMYHISKSAVGNGCLGFISAHHRRSLLRRRIQIHSNANSRVHKTGLCESFSNLQQQASTEIWKKKKKCAHTHTHPTSMFESQRRLVQQLSQPSRVSRLYFIHTLCDSFAGDGGSIACVHM